MPNNKYNQLKRQYSLDGGLTWHDLLPMVYKVGNVIETNSNCTGSDGCRWVVLPITEAYDCDSNYNMYQIEAEECLNEFGIFVRSGNIRRYRLIEDYSIACGYSGPICTPTSITSYSYDIVYNGGEVEWNEVATPVVYKITTITDIDKGCNETSSSNREEITDYTISYSPSGNNTTGEDRLVTATVKYEGENIGSFDYTQKTKVINADLEFTFSSDSVNYMLNGEYYTANTSPYANTLSNLGIDYLTNCYGAFMESSITELIKFPDVDQVDVMDSMFESCTELTSLDLSNWKTDSLISMNNMFFNCTALTSLNISSFNTSNVTEMGGLFSDCHSLTSIDVSNFDTSNNTIFDAMFSYCESLTSLNLSNFNTSNAASFGGMFEGCTSLQSLDLSMFDTSNVESYGLMFEGCTSLQSLDLSNWKYKKDDVFDSVTYNMFKNCSSLNSIVLNNVDCDTYNFIKDEVEAAGLTSQVTITTTAENCPTTKPTDTAEVDVYLYNSSTLNETYFTECVPVGNNHFYALHWLHKLNDHILASRSYLLNTNTNEITLHGYEDDYASYAHYSYGSNGLSIDLNGNTYFIYHPDALYSDGRIYVFDNNTDSFKHLITIPNVDYSTGVDEYVLINGLTCFRINELEGVAIDKDFNLYPINVKKIPDETYDRDFYYFPDTVRVYNGVEYIPKIIYGDLEYFAAKIENGNYMWINSYWYKGENINDLYPGLFTKLVGAPLFNGKYWFLISKETLLVYDGDEIIISHIEYNGSIQSIENYSIYDIAFFNEHTISISIYWADSRCLLLYDITTKKTILLENVSIKDYYGIANAEYERYYFYSETHECFFNKNTIITKDGKTQSNNVNLDAVLPYDYFTTVNGDIIFFNMDRDDYSECLYGYSSSKNVVDYFDNNYNINKMDITFTGETLTYKLNGNVYTATSSPYVVTPTDINFTSDLTSCASTFGWDYGSNLTTLNYFFDTSKVTSMSEMFTDCPNLTYINTKSFTTDNVTTMSRMFAKCSGITELDLSSWNTSKVTNIKEMFSGCTSLETLDISGWSLTKTKDISSVFYGLTSLKTLNVSNVDTSTITSMSNLFENCSSLTELDLSSWDTSNVNYFTYAFRGCSSLETLKLPESINIGTGQYLFKDCSSLTSITTSSLKTYSVTNMEQMFANCRSLTELDLSSWTVRNLSSYGLRGMFSGCTSLQTLNISGWDISNTSDRWGMFSGCTSLQNVEMNNIKANDLSDLFKDMPEIQTVNCQNANVSAMTDASYMFANCSGVTEIDLSGWNIKNLKNIKSMFENCTNLTTINLSGWNWNTSYPMYDNLFKNCNSLTTIYASNIDFDMEDILGYALNNAGLTEQVTIVK